MAHICAGPEPANVGEDNEFVTLDHKPQDGAFGSPPAGSEKSSSPRRLDLHWPRTTYCDGQRVNRLWPLAVDEDWTKLPTPTFTNYYAR
jgi:hypothetical protein